MTGKAADGPGGKRWAERRKAYEELAARVAECDALRAQKWAEITTLISNREEMEIQEEFLGDLRKHQLHTAKERTLHLANTISEAAKIASRSSQRVKELDAMKARVTEALELVEGISTQTSSLEGVTEALSKKDYEKAVGFVTRYFETEQQLKNVGEIADLTSSAHSVQMQAERDKLRDAIQLEFGEACRKGDLEAVLRFSRLFAPLDIAAEGLGLFTRHVRATIEGELGKFVKENVKKVETKDGDGTYLAILSKVLDCVAATIEGQEDHVRACFGPAGVKDFLDHVNREASSHMAPILQSLLKVITPLLDNAAGVEPPEMDSLMDDIAHISRTCHIYYQFLANYYAKADEEEAKEHPEEHAEAAAPTPHRGARPRAARKSLPAFILRCEAYELLQSVLGVYIPLQREFFRLAFLKAAALDSSKQKKEAKEGGSPFPLPTRLLATEKDDDVATAQGQGTSLVEDVFFMLRVSCHRVVQCQNPNIISAILNTIIDLLRDSLLKEIQRNVKISKEQARPGFRTMSWLNNLQMSIRYVTKLHEEFGNLLQRNKQGFEEYEVHKVTEVAFELKVLADTYSHQLEAYLQKAAEIVQAQLRARGLAEFEQLDYREAQLSSNEINDPWVVSALQAWEALLEPYHKGLNEHNFEELIKEAVNFVTHQLEALVMQKAYTQYGGLQLDKDVRALRNFFTEKTERPVRDKFTRLTHLATLLSVDKVSEVYDLWGSSGLAGGGAGNPLTWRLSSTEVKAVLALRVDFERTAIAALKLK
eukprot:EG_transcript_3136